MRPTGVVLIAIYHFLTALFLVLLAAAFVAGGTLLGGMFGSGFLGHRAGAGFGFVAGALGGTFLLCFAIVAVIAGYGIWSLREWGRILSIVLAALSLLLSFPGLLMMGLHLHLFLGSYRLFRIAIAILMIWYLVQPQIRALFQRGLPILSDHPKPANSYHLKTGQRE